MDDKEHKLPHVHVKYGEYHMRKIISIFPTKDFEIKLLFENGTEKRFDFKPYLQFPVFSKLSNEVNFQKVANHGYFIEWEGQDVDLSADTLWHEGK